MERFAKTVRGKKYIKLEILWFFDDFRGEEEEVNSLAQNCLILNANLAEIKTSKIGLRHLQIN